MQEELVDRRCLLSSDEEWNKRGEWLSAECRSDRIPLGLAADESVILGKVVVVHFLIVLARLAPVPHRLRSFSRPRVSHFPPPRYRLGVVVVVVIVVVLVVLVRQTALCLAAYCWFAN
uniref:Uncharacterized protein n=1 Tax=Plectus sambesii TaxID=2011161 RepID=A0A914V6V9_9BILA